MKYQRILKNNNKISSDATCQKHQRQITDNLTIRFVFSGNETYQIGKRQLTVYPDSFLIINQHTQYINKIDAINPVQSFSLTFDGDFLTDFMCSQICSDDKLLSGSAAGPIAHSFEETLYPLKGDMQFNLRHLKHHTDQGINDEFLLNEYLHHCLLNYYKIYNSEIAERESRLPFLNYSTRIEILRRVNLAKEFMLSNYNQNISLEAVAGYACLSVNHLLRNFKQAFGISPHQYLTHIRLQRAKHLIKTTDLPINEIVHVVGFECSSSFIRLFKSRYSITPLKYKCTA